VGAWTRFGGCPSAQHFAEERARTLAFDGREFGPPLTTKNGLPLFWIAAFEQSDAYSVRPLPLHGEWMCLVPFMWSPTDVAIRRLRRRRTALLSFIGEPFEAFLDEWGNYLAENYPAGIVLELEEIMDSLGDDVDFLRIVDALAAESGDALANCWSMRRWSVAEIRFREGWSPEDPAEFARERRSALAGWSKQGDDWPTEPTEVELQAAAAAILAGRED